MFVCSSADGRLYINNIFRVCVRRGNQIEMNIHIYMLIESILFIFITHIKSYIKDHLANFGNNIQKN